MKKINTNTDLYSYDFVINQEDWDTNNILAFIPNQDISNKGQDSICFIPFSYEKSWDYKNNARAIKYKLGNDNCLIIDTDINYQTHKKIGLPNNEEADIVLLLIEYLLQNNLPVYINFTPQLSEIQTNYFNKLIEEKKINRYNENND